MRAPKKFYFTERYVDKQRGTRIRKGDKVAIDPRYAFKDNKRRDDWIKKHIDGDVLTATYDRKGKFSKDGLIFGLKEDKSGCDWLFTRQELVLVKRCLRSRILDFFKSKKG